MTGLQKISKAYWNARVLERNPRASALTNPHARTNLRSICEDMRRVPAQRADPWVEMHDDIPTFCRTNPVSNGA